MPIPSLCPICRRQWRHAWRNERKLYHRTCDLTGKQIISMYAPDSPYTVYDQHEWHSDKWNALEHGREIDFSRPFFDQYDELMRDAPKKAIFASQNINSDYGNGIQQDKNCYMIFVSDHNEDCYYCYACDSCTDCLECLNCYKSTLCVECIDCSGSYNLAYCERCHNCCDSFLLSDCKGCTDCFGCFGLRSKQYCIFNEQYTEAEYRQKLQELNTGNFSSLQAAQKAFQDRRIKQQIHQYYDGNNNENCTGDHIVNCRNCIDCYDSGDLEDCGHLFYSYNARDCFDGHVVVENSEKCYGTISTIGQVNTQFTFASFYSRDGMYLEFCENTAHCFGCCGLRRNEYCILNKQYTKEEYEDLRAKLREHMRNTGEWGRPLPPSVSPFGYNETVAQEYFPLTKDEVMVRGWNWHDDVDQALSAYQGPKSAMPDDVSEAEDSLCGEIFTCERSGKPFKIIPQELKLYRKHNVPLPRLCFDERHLERIHKRNPRYLWERACKNCTKKLLSSYSPEREETIYCEGCYQKAVY